jgi:Tol biopolymer transport system component
MSINVLFHMDNRNRQLSMLCNGVLLAAVIFNFQERALCDLSLVFASNQSGRNQVWRVSIPPVGPIPLPTIVTTTGSGSQESRAPDWSQTSKIAYQFGASGVRGIHVINLDGSGDTRLTTSTSDEVNPSWSPDGKNVVYAALVGTSYTLWIYRLPDPSSSTPAANYQLLAVNATQLMRPTWCPDGVRIAFVTARGGSDEIAVVGLTSADNLFTAGPVTLLTQKSAPAGFIDFDPAWSPDGQQIVFSSTRTGGRDIYRMSAQQGEDGGLTRLTSNPAGDFNPAWSPDGQYIAFSSDRTGNRQIYVMSAANGEADTDNPLRRITDDSATDDDPAWNPRFIRITTNDPNSEAEIPPAVTPSVLRANLTQNAWTQHRSPLLLKIKSTPLAELRVYAAADPTSGGHSHAASARPHGWLSVNNWQSIPPFFKKGDPSYQEGGTTDNSSLSTGAQLTTDSQGDARIYYIASELGGQETITVSTPESDVSQRVSMNCTITVAVPSLEGLPIDSNIKPTGGGPGYQHLANHYGTANLVQALRALALNYASESPRGSLPSSRLPVNDMSLVTGGLFDYDASYEWETPHIGHRLGFEVDVGGPNTGDGLIPGNSTFERILNEQGWWLNSPKLWASEGDHYHLITTGTGKTSIVLPGQATVSNWDPVSGQLTFSVPVENRGGLDADSVTFDQIDATSGVTVLGPALPAQIGPLPIRQTQPLSIEVEVPPRIKGFLVRCYGSATAPERPGAVFTFPQAVQYYYKAVRIPQPIRQMARPRTASLASSSDWEFSFTDPDQTSVSGSTSVYHGEIRNHTGAELFLTDLSFGFAPSPALDSYKCDFAQEFLDTGGVIPPGGYAGPIVFVQWPSPPPLGTVGAGYVELTVDSGLNPVSYHTEFRQRSGYAANLASIIYENGTATVTFYGIPGQSYDIQRSTDLSIWSTIATTTASVFGKIEFTDVEQQIASYYRTTTPP